MTYEPDPALEWASRILLRVEVGSTAHGTGTTEHEDYDEIGIMTLPWEQSIGVPVRPDRDETITYRPGRREGERSQPGDYDLVVHSARKFARLAAEGNPSILMVLFGPFTFSTQLGDDLLEIRDAFWSERARAKFLGYMRAQRERLEGVRGGKHTNRPELVGQFGYDTKYAMHMLRLGMQGIEYMEAAYIMVPMRDTDRYFLRAVRTGNVPYETVIECANNLEARLADVKTEAPPEPNLRAINAWLLDCFDASVMSGGWR